MCIHQQMRIVLYRDGFGAEQLNAGLLATPPTAYWQARLSGARRLHLIVHQPT